MKKVLIVAALSGFIKGFLQDDIKILQGMGYDVHCAANSNDGVTNPQELWRQLNVQFYNINFDSKKPLARSNLYALLELRKVLVNGYDLIHCHTPIAGCITRILSQKYRAMGTKVVYTSHGFYFHKQSNIKTWILYYTIEKIMSLITDTIITINKEDYRAACTMYFKNVYYINGVGIDIARFDNVCVDRFNYRYSIGVNPDDIMILSAGELTERKNHRVIIKALADLGDPRLVFVLCGRAIRGTGTYDMLVNFAAEKNVRFKILGFRKDMEFLYFCADIAALPSAREGLGMMGLEALASGIPLVSSNVQGIVDYMEDGKTGFMAFPHDFKGFAVAIKKLIDSKLRFSMGKHCVDAVKPFSKEVSSKQKKDIYSSILLKLR